MSFKELLLKDRSCRRFKQDQKIERVVLEELVDLGRISSSAANLQPLKYMLSCDVEINATIFPHLAWAAYLTDWPGPVEGERPAAYIIMLGDTEISQNFGVDHGIAAQNILLGATEKGLGGCMVGALDRRGLSETLKIPGHYEILLVLALGVPNEESRLVDAVDSIKYTRDESDVHIVPKRLLSEIILN